MHHMPCLRLRCCVGLNHTCQYRSISCHVWHFIHLQSANKIIECLLWMRGWGLHFILQLLLELPSMMICIVLLKWKHKHWDGAGTLRTTHSIPTSSLGQCPHFTYVWIWRSGSTYMWEEQPTSHLQQVFCGTKIPLSSKMFAKIHQTPQPVCPLIYFFSINM